MQRQPILKRALTVHSVPPRILATTAVAALAGAAIAFIQGWPVWAIGLAVVLPWLPVLTREIAWTYRHYQWMALFYLLVVTQGGHVIEHVAQMVQIHLLGLRGASARGIFGALDIEWVHFVWNTWVLLAVFALLWRFRSNGWLAMTLVFAAWHEAEHVAIMIAYLDTGVPGTPGLLARGGMVAGGLPLARPDLHFIYNAVETIPLALGFVWQLRRAYDEWLRRALPRVPAVVLAETTARLQTAHIAPGQTVIREGDPADRFYVVVQGELAVTRVGADGDVREIDRLGPGEYFGEIGLLRRVPRTASVTARTPVEVLVLDRDGFRQLLTRSTEARQDVTAVAARRAAQTAGITPPPS
jgi:hypothetical protein